MKRSGVGGDAKQAGFAQTCRLLPGPSRQSHALWARGSHAHGGRAWWRPRVSVPRRVLWFLPHTSEPAEGRAAPWSWRRRWPRRDGNQAAAQAPWQREVVAVTQACPYVTHSSAPAPCLGTVLPLFKCWGAFWPSRLGVGWTLETWLLRVSPCFQGLPLEERGLQGASRPPWGY